VPPILLLRLSGQRKPWAIEIERGLAPRLDPGFHLAGKIVAPERRLVVYGGAERFPLAEGIEALVLTELCAEVSAA